MGLSLIRKFAIHFLIGLVIATTCTTAFFGYRSFKSSYSLMDFQKRQVEIKDLQGEIMRLDEVLTMSARMAAATGNGDWEVRYNHFDPLLETAINRLLAIVPGTLGRLSTTSTDDANQKLVKMERLSFDLGKRGQLHRATEILSSPEYLRQKEVYATGMKDLNLQINADMTSEREKYERDVRNSYAASIILFVLSCLGWIIVASQIRRWGREIVALNQKLGIERDLAEEANRSKSLFLANMSHELRTPMHGILSFARFGVQKADAAPKEKLKYYYVEILDSGTRLMRLLNDLLDISKLESGKFDYTLQENDLVTLIQGVCSEMSALAAEKGISFYLKKEADTPLLGRFDFERVAQVVRNLLSNAIKFSDPGSAIRIELSQHKDGLSVAVVNRGVGIPPDELKSVFDKFVQSSKTKTGAGGTGLGLAICQEIVRQHGGRIWAESDPDGETKIEFCLPLMASVPELERKSA